MRKAKIDDFSLLYEKIFNNKEVSHFLWDNPLSKQKAKEFFLNNFAFNNYLGFAPLVEKTNYNIIGYAGILPFDYFQKKNQYEFGYVLAKEFWNKGYASEIANAQINFIQKNFKNAAIFATVHPQNIASQKILEKVGMKFLQEANLPKGKRLIFTL